MSPFLVRIFWASSLTLVVLSVTSPSVLVSQDRYSGKKRRAQQGPVIENGLGERLSTGRGTQIGVETEGLRDGEVRLHGVHGGTRALLRREDVTTTDVEDGLRESTRIQNQLLEGDSRRYHPGPTRGPQSRPRTWAPGDPAWRGAGRRSRHDERWG